MRKLISRLIGVSGFELCRLNSSELDLQRSLDGNGRAFNFKDIQLIKAVSAQGHITIEEARFLTELVRQTQPDETLIEIGTLFGFSTLVIALAKQARQPLITVDNYSWNPLGMTSEAHRLATAAMLKEAQATENVHVLASDKDAFYAGFDRSTRVGLFFCDADHRYEATKADLLWARSIGARVICGHDYDPVRHKDVTRAVDELGGPRRLVGSLFVL
jgi:predicted O-methyltransferase YrrM